MYTYYFDYNQDKLQAVTEKQAYYIMYKRYGFNKKRVINLLATNDIRSSKYQSWVNDDLTRAKGYVQLALSI